MGFKERHVVVRYVIGQPLLCERAFDARKDAEEFGKNIAESAILVMRTFDPTIEELDESYEKVFFTPDAVDLGTLNPGDQEMPPGRAGRAAMADPQRRESQVSRVTDTGPSTDRGPRVVSKTTTPVTAKQDSRGTETRAAVDQKGETKAAAPAKKDESVKKEAEAPKVSRRPEPSR